MIPNINMHSAVERFNILIIHLTRRKQPTIALNLKYIITPTLINMHIKLTKNEGDNEWRRAILC